MDTQWSGKRIQPQVPPPLVPPPIPPAKDPPVRRSFFERLLDPKTIQWLLGSGGVLLVAGLVIWLASLGVFDNPWIVAGAMGAATLAVMSGGWAMLKRTRYTLAGRAITLLACLVMPLNLWFYHANNLVTIEGHLWVAALGCCVLYALSALILTDALFVYVLLAGVASTGLLILADMHRLAEIASPSVLLMVLGLVSLHVERAFSADESKPFSRGRFGKACFLSAQFLIAGSLGLLAAAQIIGYLHLPNLMAQVPAIVTDRSLQILAIVVTLLGAYACVYSGIVGRSEKFFYPAMALFVWSHIQAIHTLELTQLRHAPWLMLAPLAYMAAAAVFRKHAISPRLRLVANALGLVIVLGALRPAIHDTAWAMPVARTFALAAAAYVLATIAQPRSVYTYLASFCASIAAVLVLKDQNASNLVAVSCLAAIALVQVAAGRTLAGVLGEETSKSVKQAGLVFLSIISVGQTLFSLSRMAQSTATVGNALSLGALAIAAALAATLASSGWKRWLLTLSVGQGVVAMGMLAHLSNLSVSRKFEIFSVALGLLLLAIAHVAWHREEGTSQRSGLASVGLTLGSLLATIPLLIAVIAHRCTTGLSLPDELLLLSVGMALFVAGVLLEIRATTIAGAVALGIHLVILMISAGMRAQLAVGVYLALGGGLLFGIGVLLSIYRERLLAIPADIRQRKGVFKVLSWR